MAKVDVKLTGPTWVNGAIHQAGEIVEMDPKIAAEFGEVQEIPEAPKKVSRKKSEE